ncbi:hypothetical protein [Rhizobium sp. AN80A]|uniref:hypothetical protein n=1 Tax=Rhizobium sp. AN80A TaxID=3040673 RepID=UPI0024B39862|nr:hypothetical protein [Rhizobium sp. AN80A]
MTVMIAVFQRSSCFSCYGKFRDVKIEFGRHGHILVDGVGAEICMQQGKEDPH